MAIAAVEHELRTRQAELGPSSKMAYFRFTVDNNIDRSAFEEWKFPSVVAQHTENFLRSVQTKIQACAVKLIDIPGTKYMNTESAKSIKEDDQANPYQIRSGGKFINFPFSRNTGFVGRHRELEALHRGLEENGRVVLHGLGGMDKTQLALEYANRYSAKNSSVLRFDLGSPQSALLSYTDIHREMLPENEHHTTSSPLEPKSNPRDRASLGREVSMFKSIIERNATKDWLLVFDNADDLESFSANSFTLDCEAHIIVTKLS